MNAGVRPSARIVLVVWSRAARTTAQRTESLTVDALRERVAHHWIVERGRRPHVGSRGVPRLPHRLDVPVDRDRSDDQRRAIEPLRGSQGGKLAVYVDVSVVANRFRLPFGSMKMLVHAPSEKAIHDR